MKHYFASGMCVWCHPSAVPPVDSCRDCLAWGATRQHDWLCAGCRSWRREHSTLAACPTCSRDVTLGEYGCCRLCRKQAKLAREDKGLIDVRTANAQGQQLFFADMFYVSARTRRRPALHQADPNTLTRTPTEAAFPGRLLPVQLTLFDARRQLAMHGRAGLVERCEPNLAAWIDTFVRDHARRHGWHHHAIVETTIGIRILAGLRDDPKALIKATDADLLRPIEIGVIRVLQLLAEMQLLDDDRSPAVDVWFAEKTIELPEQIRDELGIWFVVMRDGSTTAPRRKPRAEATINVQLRFALPAIRAWVADGITSLREVTREQILAVLPEDRNGRAGCGQALKSIFSILKQRKVIFTDPSNRITTGWYQPREPVPQSTALLRAALASPDPAQAVIVALIAYHGLRNRELRNLQLIDIQDGKLTLGDRVIPLAPAVRERIGTYLDERERSWPNTVNPHLLINTRSAWRDTCVGHRWIQLKIGDELTVQAIREDRILDEAHATRGDTRRLSDLFGLSITAASRYTDTVAHPAFAESEKIR